MSVLALSASLALAASGTISDHHPECTGAGLAVSEICDVLRAQEAAWNAGDINGFMDGYWQSPHLRFASGGSVTTGWEETLARYLARYDTDAAMGDLEFSGVQVDQLSPDSAIVFGRWQLHREHDRPAGLFTLVFRHIDEAWVIVHDHTSSAD